LLISTGLQLDYENFQAQRHGKGLVCRKFEPCAYKTDLFEVNYRTHPKGEQWDYHYHTESTEINLIVSGSMIFNDTTLSAGDIFIVDPWQISDPTFVEDTSVVCIRLPSVNDKQIIRIEEK
jgi:hypothetical protein